jgi:hypothetical protein
MNSANEILNRNIPEIFHGKAYTHAGSWLLDMIVRVNWTAHYISLFHLIYKTWAYEIKRLGPI